MDGWYESKTNTTSNIKPIKPSRRLQARKRKAQAIKHHYITPLKLHNYNSPLSYPTTITITITITMGEITMTTDENEAAKAKVDTKSTPPETGTGPSSTQEQKGLEATSTSTSTVTSTLKSSAVPVEPVEPSVKIDPSPPPPPSAQPDLQPQPQPQAKLQAEVGKELEPLQIGDSAMVLVTWRDGVGGNEKLQVVVVERRPSNFWKRRSKKRKLYKKSGSGSGSAVSTAMVAPVAAVNTAGATGSDQSLGDDGKAKLLGVCSSEEGELAGLKADEIQYYVHYVEHDR
jgi:hypothetical protein